jgi:hypothetical protein
MAKKDGLYTKILTSPKNLKIVYSDPITQNNDIDVFYKLRDNSFVEHWTERLLSAQQLNYQIDDPERFYGFNQDETLDSVDKINQCIRIINSHDKIITRTVSIPIDHDTLNYLHNIFEIYHGLLDKQNHVFFMSAPANVKKALAELNILVHRCESCIRGLKPRHVVTYFGLPKTKLLLPEHYNLLTDNYQFGSVYMNYVEIGKTLEDLAIDDDQYISDDAFRPYHHYSADFVVLFHNSIMSDIQTKRKRMKEFYSAHADFFISKNINFDDPMIKPGRIPIADLDSHGTELLQLLKTRQFVKSVSLI